MEKDMKMRKMYWNILLFLYGIPVALGEKVSIVVETFFVLIMDYELMSLHSSYISFLSISNSFNVF